MDARRHHRHAGRHKPALKVVPERGGKFGANIDGNGFSREVHVLCRPGPRAKPEVHRKASLDEPRRIRILEEPREQPFHDELEL